MEIRLQRIFLKALIACTSVSMATPLLAQNSQSNDSQVLEKIITPDLERRNITEDKIDSEDWEAGFYVGVINIEDFGSDTVVGVRLAHHITEDFFLEANYAQSQAGETSFERLSGSIEILNDGQRDYTYYNLTLGYNLFPGEVFIGKDWAFNTAFYVVAGVGNTTFADNDFFTATFGGGLRFFATDSIALHFDVRNHLFDSDILGESETTQNLEAHIGATYYF